jgi:uncharacterized protein
VADPGVISAYGTSPGAVPPAVVPADDLPGRVRVIDPVWIPLRDGSRLAARLWLPQESAVPGNAKPRLVPGILEGVPYRRGDITLADDEVRFGYVAAHGYACLRVDLRGSGDSDGVLPDEYDPQEQADLVEVIDWLAAQPWCTGSVGMTGISWSGFNCLEVAAHRPPALKAIITACSSDDRYDNDVHYIGGAVLAFYMAVWGHAMLGFNARPPDPAVVGADRWRDLWLGRLEGNELLSERWLRHQARDGYWRQGSVIEDYAAIECPVLVVGGWADAYTDTLLRLADGLTSPHKVIIGPWGHGWPERGIPGPAIGFLQESIRWWDHWLKGTENGADSEPLIRYYQQDYVKPAPGLVHRPGRWLAATAVPHPDRDANTRYLGDGTLDEVPAAPEPRTVRTPQGLGALAGSWLPYGNPTDLPPDQAPEDALSLTFDSGPLAEPLDITGQPVLYLTVSSDQPLAVVIARLCEVAPDGSSALLSRGVLNLTHRDGHAEPRPLEPGCRYPVRVPLKAIGATITAGHRLRIALSTTYWPWVWPSPVPATVTVHAGTLRLPRIGGGEGAPMSTFARAEIAAPPVIEQLRERHPQLGEVSYNEATGVHVYALRRDLNGAQRFPSGLRYADTDGGTFAISDTDPLSARLDLHRVTEISRGGWHTEVETTSEMWCTAETFELRSRLAAREAGAEVFARDYRASIPRLLG